VSSRVKSGQVLLGASRFLAHNPFRMLFAMIFYQWLVDSVEKERKLFENESYLLMDCDCQNFASRAQLIQGSTGGERARQRKKRARLLLVEIYFQLGSEVLFLCVLTISLVKLSKLEPRAAIADLAGWWKQALRPASLTKTASELCENHAGFFLKQRTQSTLQNQKSIPTSQPTGM
jgi:hypothetical protein